MKKLLLFSFTLFCKLFFTQILFSPAISSNVNESQRTVCSADFNSDGILDIVTAHPLSNILRISLGNNTGNFAVQTTTLATQIQPETVTTADFNNDNLPDLVCNNRLSNTISVFLNSGSGNFSSANNISVTNGPGAVISDNFNQDNNQDIIVLGSGFIQILLGNGNGTFSAPTNYVTNGGNDSFLCSADFNNDGKKDLAVAAYKTWILLGDGLGGFSAPTGYLYSTFGVFGICAGDLNGDNNLDIISAFPANNSIGVLLGDGTGNFGTYTQYTTGSQPQNVVCVDFNKDGKLDVASVNYGSNSVTIFNGNGDGTLRNRLDYAVGGKPQILIARDVNNDNKIDLVTTNGKSSFTSTLLNNNTILSTSENFKSKVQVYPNPFNENLNISTQENGQMYFYDASGKLVSTSFLMKGDNFLNKSSLKSGIYIYQIKNKNGEIVSSGKIIKK